MINLVSKNPLVRKIVENNANKEMLDWLLEKKLAFTEEENLESLVFVLKDEDLKSRALNLLKSMSESVKENYVKKKESNHRVVYYLLLEALEFHNTNLISKIIQNQALPFTFLSKIAEEGNASDLEILLENQIKLIAYSEIMDLMEKNPKINNFTRGRINEIREFYLNAEESEDIPEDELVEEVKAIISKDKELLIDKDENIEEMPETEIEKNALTILQKINKMSIPEKIQLALLGTKVERMILVRDPNKMVSSAVIESPKISQEEISLLVKNRSVPGEIIEKIAKNREYTKNYSIVVGLVQNPKTPITNALSFIKKLYIKDLQLIIRDKEVNPIIKNLAFNYHKEKSGIKKGY